MERGTGLASWAVELILKSVVEAAKWTASARNSVIGGIMVSGDEAQKELVALRQEVARLTDLVAILQDRLIAEKPRTHVTTKLRIQIMRHIELFKIPARKAHEYFGIARSTVYRWRREPGQVDKKHREPANKTPIDIVRLVWEIFGLNEKWGCLRIAQQVALLNIFLSASTVRNILNRSKPRQARSKPGSPRAAAKSATKPHPIAAQHPNDVWSADLTSVKTWGFWPTHLLAVIDHFSRSVVTMIPLKRADSESLTGALERAFTSAGAPTRLITDDGSIFTAGHCTAFLKKWNVCHEIGALGMANSMGTTAECTAW